MNRDVLCLDQLSLPKRQKTRRFLMPHETFSIGVEQFSSVFEAEVMDLSFMGLGLMLKEPWQNQGKSISIISSVGSSSARITYQQGLRLGVSWFYQVFTQENLYLEALGEETFQVDPFNLYAFCKDPFLWDEFIPFKINSLSVKGFEAIVSSKSLWPGMKLSLKFFFPNGSLIQNCQISKFIFPLKNDEFKIFVFFDNPSKSLFSMISDFFLNFKKIDFEGFSKMKIPKSPLNSISFLYEKYFISDLPKSELFPVQKDLKIPMLSAYLDKKLVASCQILSLDRESCAEILNFKIHSSFHLSQFFLHFLRHWIHFSEKNQLKYFFIFIDRSLREVFHKSGFVLEKKDLNVYLAKFFIEDFKKNKDKNDKNIWNVLNLSRGYF